jgi:hypothetical protein
MITNILVDLWSQYFGLVVIHLNKLEVETSRRKRVVVHVYSTKWIGEESEHLEVHGKSAALW